MSVKIFNFTLVFFKADCHANPAVVRKRASKTHTFQDIYFESSQIHLLAIMLRFEYKNENILLNFKIFKNFFSAHVICISNIFQI